MLTENQKTQIKEALYSSERPLFFFHDDADGLCSFLQFYKQVNRGKGVVVKSNPIVDERFIKTAKNYSPDKIFLLDLAMLDQDFVDQINCPIYWVDHHDRQDIGDDAIKGVNYFNPKQNNSNSITCISKISYDIFGEYLWISATGTIGDWQLPEDLKEKIIKEYPKLFDSSIKRPEQALFDSPFGKIAKIMNFILKGNTKDVLKSIKVLTRIEEPSELLEVSSERGKFLRKRFDIINKEYEKMLAEAEKRVSNDDNDKKENKILIYEYPGNKISLSGELSNELLYRHSDKIIIVARHHDGFMKTSFRSGKDIIIKDILEQAIVGIDGRAGGHDHACGGLIKDTDWQDFINNIKAQL